MSDDFEQHRLIDPARDRGTRRRLFIAASHGEHIGELLSEAEVGSLLEAQMTARSLSGEGATDTEFQMLLRWAERTKIDDLMIRAVVERKVAIDYDELNDIYFDAEVPDELWVKYADVGFSAADELGLVPADGVVERLVLEAFLVNRRAQRRTVARAEAERVVDWTRAAAANLDLLDLIVKHPNTTVRITSNGSVLVGVSTFLDEPRDSSEPAA